MLLAEYAASLVYELDQYVAAGLVVDSSVVIDARTPVIGAVRGNVTFADGSRLTSWNISTFAKVSEKSPIHTIIRPLSPG